METSTMFEQASRLKLRFDSTRGQLSVEDLWDIPLTSPSGNRTNLDSIAVDLHRQTRDAADTVSFVNPSTENPNAAITQLKFEIVKHVIGVRVAERDTLRDAADRREKKQRLLELIARKEDEALGEKSVDELRALAESL
jgi:hypothetical protein